MKVAYVSPHAARGGAERVTMDLLALHDRASVEPIVFFLRDGPLVAEARALGIQVEVFRTPRMRYVLSAERAKRTLAFRLSERHVDLVHGVMSWGHDYAGAAAGIAKIPAVWFQHDVPNWKSPINWLAALTPARRVFANSEWTASGLRRFNPRRVKIEIVHPGTRIPTEPRAARAARGRAAVGARDGEFLVGIVARLARPKGHRMLFQAAASLCNARPDARIIVAGESLFGLDPEYPRELQQLARDLGIADKVRFIGGAQDVGDVLSALDVAVHLPELPESFGLAVVEGMANGAAVVAADNGAVREIVEPGATAFLVPPGDHEALAAQLLALHDDPERRRAVAAAGEAAARERFDILKTTKHIEQIYRDVLDARR